MDPEDIKILELRLFGYLTGLGTSLQEMYGSRNRTENPYPKCGTDIYVYVHAIEALCV